MTDSLYNTELSTPLTEPLYGGVLALGNFDGVHRGHQAVIKAALDQAKRLGGVPTRVLTLEPHSKTVFHPDSDPFRLTPGPAKVRYLKTLGVDGVMVLNFTPEFSCMTASDFINQIIVRQHRARHVVAGFDFVFGYQKAGSMQTLRESLIQYGIGVTEVMPFRDVQGEVMSSSRTRDALRAGDVDAARHILGRPWSIDGVIQSGEKRGRVLGFPTANIDLGDYLRPRFGVYAVYAHQIGSSRLYPGVANIGVRPTVEGKCERLEFHLFDFHETIYGESWEVELIAFLRPEERFESFEALQRQIAKDAEEAKAVLTL